ncbi:pyruvate formate lyase-activating protein [Sporanaerobium hydrogeniformans]|uniref:Pyruvate formate lyase-activating protein n=1 Tax=Sporanaerobium hydrogeniformans TaxID=3072179 RepID=A0AC61DCJ9_9FIRM|nr:radical SAM protein [Sporanaerobium hydrogeniformans]PHV70480.1 pyruvate formate lyase-activating protein [Sporanaerobium hydrogeniformans]
MRIFRKGFNYSQDGPGNRLVYHLQSCNFRCKWCSNPESIGKSCALSIDCTVDELVDEIMRSKRMFFDGGGITLTGGEPTMQYEEMIVLLERLKSIGIHTVIETNGSHPRLLEVLPYIDFLIMDVKHYDDEVHRKYTGVSNRQIRDNLEKLCRLQREVLIRIPIINGINNDAQGFLDYFNQWDTSSLTFEFLPYHEYGKEKWEEPYEIQHGFITSEDLEQFKRAFNAHHFKIIET